MVTLSKLYTKTGDGGMTRLGDMSQVPKTSARIAAYGCVDELNSVIGLARASGAEHDDVLARVQNDLFDLGADLCVPQADGAEERLRVQPQQVLFLEQQIDDLTRDLAPLRSFILPGDGFPLLGSTLRGRCVGAPSVRLGNSRSKSRSASQFCSISTGSPICCLLWRGLLMMVGRRMCCGSRGRARTMRKWILVGSILGGGV